MWLDGQQAALPDGKIKGDLLNERTRAKKPHPQPGVVVTDCYCTTVNGVKRVKVGDEIMLNRKIPGKKWKVTPLTDGVECIIDNACVETVLKVNDYVKVIITYRGDIDTLKLKIDEIIQVTSIDTQQSGFVEVIQVYAPFEKGIFPKENVIKIEAPWPRPLLKKRSKRSKRSTVSE